MTDEGQRFLETLDEMTWWMGSNVCIGMGAFRQFDYTMEGSAGRDLTPRLGRCYELAVKAFVGWEQFKRGLLATNSIPVPQIPAPATLIHGSWEHRDPEVAENGRIGHAWVELEDGYIWEPVTALICEPTLFHIYGQTVDVETYSETAARINMVRSQHFGPWHEVDEKGLPR